MEPRRDMALGSAVEGAALGGRAPGGPATEQSWVPLSYLEDPEQLAIYRWRAIATTAMLAALLFVLSWAAGQLLRSAVDVLRPVGEAVRLTG
jgi:hypothetical protein